MSRLKHQLSKIDLVIYSFTFGLLSTFLKGYRFGAGDQIEQIPIILRQINSSYLINDFFTNATAGFGPRFYYAKIISLISSNSLLPYNILGFTLLTNISICLVTAFFTWWIFRSKLAAIFAIIAVSTFDYDLVTTATRLQHGILIPSAFALPFLLLSIWKAIQGNLLTSIFMVIIATFIHPSLGLGTAGIIIAGSIAGLITQKETLKFIKNSSKFLKTITALIFFILISSIVWLIPSMKMKKLPTDQFMKIFGYVRSPHHILPKTWNLSGYIDLIAFVIAFFGAWLWLKNRNSLSKKNANLLAIFVCLILLGCIATYFLADVFLVRFWATIQPFRFLFLVKWLGIVLLSGMISVMYSDSKNNGTGQAFVLLFSLLNPITTALSVLLIGWKEKIIQLIPRSKYLLSLELISILILIFLTRIKIVEIKLFNQFLITMFILYIFLPHIKLSRMLLIPVSLLLIILIFIQPVRIFPKSINSYLKSLKPIITLNDQTGEVAQLANFAKLHTDKQSIFLTPFYWGEFRLFAGRAIVVDFKALPFRDLQMQEWYDRVIQIYGDCIKHKNTAREKCYEKNYQNINDLKISLLKSQYGFSYAIFYKDMPTLFPVLYTSDKFKVVKIN